MKNKLKETIEFVGLSYKKEILKIAIINVAFLVGAFAIYFLLKNLIFALITLVGLLVADYFLLSRFNDKKKNLLKSR